MLSRQYVRNVIAESPLIYPHDPIGFQRRIKYQVWSTLIEDGWNLDHVCERAELTEEQIWEFLSDGNDYPEDHPTNNVRFFALLIYGMDRKLLFDIKDLK